MPVFSCADVSSFISNFTKGKTDRKSTRLNSSHSQISYAVFCLKKKKTIEAVILEPEAAAVGIVRAWRAGPLGTRLDGLARRRIAMCQHHLRQRPTSRSAAASLQ